MKVDVKTINKKQLTVLAGMVFGAAMTAAGKSELAARTTHEFVKLFEEEQAAQIAAFKRGVRLRKRR